MVAGSIVANLHRQKTLSVLRVPQEDRTRRDLSTLFMQRWWLARPQGLPGLRKTYSIGGLERANATIRPLRSIRSMRRSCQVCGAQIHHGHPARCPNHWRCDGCQSTKNLCYYGDGVWCEPCRGKQRSEKCRLFQGDTGDTSEPICPHCGTEQSDGWDLSEGQNNCEFCERDFVLHKHYEVTYSTEKEI